MHSVCKGVISVRHIYLMYHTTPSLYYVITDIYGAYVQSRLCTSCHVCCYIKWSEKRLWYTEAVRQHWVEFNCLH